MSIAQNYFLLCHGEQLENLECVLLKQNPINDDFLHICALILGTNRALFKQYNSFESFKALCQEVSLFIPENTRELNVLQFSLIEKIESNLHKIDIKTLLDTFSYLFEQNIINKDLYKKLLSIFDTSKFETQTTIQTTTSSVDFLEQKQNLTNFINQIKSLCQDPTALSIVDDTSRYIKEQKFSIGVTGVINSGKSSMLNALLKQNILGTNIVPETANLSVLRHSEKVSFVVNYWDGTSQSVIDLEKYTSAKSSKSEQIKSVEIGMDINFLDKSIEIVDTPGLDDPVVLREEITKEYISRCDLMLHLMNVNQSATEKDMEFILDALLYQNISKLLVVITKADTVTPDELHEVIEYVKRSIRNKLQSVPNNTKLDFILQNLMIVPISTVTNDGIETIENYLKDTLFGEDNQKTNLIISSTKQRIGKAITIEKEALEYKLQNLDRSAEELEEQLQLFTKEKAQAEQEYHLIESNIKRYKNTINNHLLILETFLQSEFKTLNEILLRRVVDDINYELKNNKAKPDSDRIKTIITITLNDGILDIIRDYKYKLLQKIDSIAQQFQELEKFDISMIDNGHFDSGFLTSSHLETIQGITAEIENTKLSKLSNISSSLFTIVDQTTLALHEKIENKAKELSVEFLDKFFRVLHKPLEQYKEQLNTKETTLKEMLENASVSNEDKENISIEIYNKLQKLQKAESELSA